MDDRLNVKTQIWADGYSFMEVTETLLTALGIRTENSPESELGRPEPTLGVEDLEASLQFYRDGLGFASEGIIGEAFEHGAVVFIHLQPGLRLALWPRSSIAHDSGLELGPASSTEMTLGHNVASKADVDAVMAIAETAGAVIVKPQHETFWGGYSGYFKDPDGHLWEIVWNPQLLD